MGEGERDDKLSLAIYGFDDGILSSLNYSKHFL